MSQFRKVATWTSKIVILLSTAIYTMISIQPLFQPAASAAAQGMVFTSAVGVTIFRVSFAGLPLGCAAFLVYCLLSKGRTMTGLVFCALSLGIMLVVRACGMEVDSSVQQSMPLVLAEVVLVAITLAGIAVEVRARSEA